MVFCGKNARQCVSSIYICCILSKTITKLDKNDFIIVKKLNMPIEIDYFGQKKTIKEKSFKSLTATRIERNGSKNSG